MRKNISDRLFRSFFRGIAELDTQIDKLRSLRDSDSLRTNYQTGTRTVGTGKVV